MRYSLILSFLAILIAVNGMCYGFEGSEYSGTYVDAEPANTVAVDGTDPWFSTVRDTATADSLWWVRGFANVDSTDNNTINSDGAASSVDAPILATTISGLEPYLPYSVYVILWSGEANDWDILAGLKPDELTEYSRLNGGTVLTGALDGNRVEIEGLLGIGFADASGGLSAYIDNIAEGSERGWYDGLVYGPAFMAYHPTPDDGAINIALDAVLTWEPMRDSNNPSETDPTITEHKIYINDDPNVLEGQSFTVAAGQTLEVDPALEANKTYYWRVDEVTSTETVTGAEWTFNTIKTVPDFNPPLGSQPVDTAVLVGANATLTAVAGTSGGGGGTINYQWYVGLPGDYNNLVSGATSSDLVIAVQAADEGDYFCKATNNVGSTDSDSAQIKVNRLMAHYKYDQSIDDETGNTTPVKAADPNFVEGIDSDAIILNGNEHIDLGVDGLPNNTTPSGCLYSGTVSFWAKTTGAGTVLGNFLDGGNTGVRFDIGQSLLRGEGGVALNITYNASLVNDGQWHLLTTTYDSGAAPNFMTLYIDGEEYNTVTQGTMVHLEWLFPTIIGGFTNRADGPADLYDGDLDDMRIYNYPLNSFEVARLFVDFVPDADPICANRPEFDFTGPDGTPDCKVNLYDFAEIAADWLVCNIIPTSDCQ